MSGGSIVVVDIGKTLSKVTLWTKDGELRDRRTRPNQARTIDGLRRLDTAGIADWIVEVLSSYRERSVEAIIPVGHGAGIVALDAGGTLAFEPLDYEQSIPDDVMSAYRAERDAFELTGSPPLPDGLNIGSQLFWLQQIYPETMRTAVLVPWAQYWAWFLCGIAASEVTSLGCHSDLWLPHEGTFSPLAVRMGWSDRFAAIARASDVIGTLRGEIAAKTGLSPRVQVLAGLHDSNAALLAARGFGEIADNEATILSTGTWFIAMRSPGKGRATPRLPSGRDCLFNVDASGNPVPSARFMGGREIETVIEIDTRRVDIKPDQPRLMAAVPELLRNSAMLLPTLAPGYGPFPEGKARWLGEPADWHARRAAACLYAALVADQALDLIGAEERLLVEGRFAEAQVFVKALAALRPDMQVFTANAHNDVSFGAMRLVNPSLRPQGRLALAEPIDGDLDTYRSRWLAELDGRPAGLVA